MDRVKESIIDFFYDTESGWPTTDFLYVLGLLALVGYFGLQKRSRNKRKS